MSLFCIEIFAASTLSQKNYDTQKIKRKNTQKTKENCSSTRKTNSLNNFLFLEAKAHYLRITKSESEGHPVQKQRLRLSLKMENHLKKVQVDLTL